MENKLVQVARRVFTMATWSIATNQQKVYLTFDDGPHPTITPWVLDLLDEYAFKATFFCIGNNIVKYPEVFAEIKRRGHRVANHSQNHLRGLTTVNSVYFNDVELAAKYFDTNLFRPPYGKIKLSQYNYLKKRYRLILWSVLSKDYDATINCEQCLVMLKQQTKLGSIIVFHDSDKAQQNLNYLLPKYLQFLKQQGLQSDRIV